MLLVLDYDIVGSTNMFVKLDVKSRELICNIGGLRPLYFLFDDESGKQFCSSENYAGCKSTE